MDRLCVLLLLVVLVNAGAVIGSQESSKHRRHEHQQRQQQQQRMFKDLRPQEPTVEYESDGGRLETWGGKGSGVFEDANVAACRTVLKRRGLWLPAYVDAPTLHIVTRGAGRVGIVTPFSDRQTQENTFRVEKGDVVALPQGHVVWWYNEEDRDLEIVGVADVTQSSRPAGLRAFHLAGGAKRDQQEEQDQEQAGYGAIIHGFSKDVLSRAWEMNKEDLRELLESQNEVGIVKLDEDITFPDSDQRDNAFFQNFIYRFGNSHADLRVENGGELRELNSFKLPVLKYLGLGMECMHLEQDAMVAPNWFIDAHQVMYVIKGRGRVEAVYHNGEKALETDLEEGSLVVIPAFFPSTKIAARDDNFHYITFVTSHRPVISYLSGRNSVYQAIPLRVLARVLNVDEDRARQIQKAHAKESVIFAGESSERDEGRREAL